MPEILGRNGENDFFHRGSFYPNPKESSVFLSLDSLVDVYFPPQKRARVDAPFVFNVFGEQQVSIDVLPDECLFEILRRVPGGQERSACAGVSKRWLTLVSSICRNEKLDENVIMKNCEDDVEFEGYLSRSLEGKKVTDIRLQAIAVGTSSRGGLGKLSIHGNSSSKVSDLGVKAIANGCSSLRALSLWNLSTISDVGLLDISRGCPQLQKIDLCSCPAITDKALIAIAKSCSNLTELTIESCSSIGNEGLQAVAHFCPNLKSVSIKNCPLVGDQGVAALVSKTKGSLMKLKLQMLNITDVSLAVVGHYGLSITDLVLSGLRKVSGRGYWVMGNGIGLQKLKSLCISSCQGVTDAGLEAVGKGCPNLKQFSLTKCSFLSDNGLVSFAKSAVSLESLKLEECHRVTQIGFFGSLLNCGSKFKVFSLVNCLGIKDINTGYPPLSPCKSLQSLSISNCPGFGDANLEILGKLCPNLQDLELCGLDAITDSGVCPLLQSSQLGLVKVSLAGSTNLTDRVVSTVTTQNSWTLEALNLDGCTKITDASLFSIAKHCQLLSDLDVSKCSITDSGIQALASSQNLNLQVLSVVDCSRITDKSFSAIVELGHSLFGLNLQRCVNISSCTIDLLLEQLWRCDIIY